MPQQKKTKPLKRLKKGDSVVIIAGVHKGKTGTILKVLPEKNRVLIEGINVVQRAYRRGVNPNLPEGGFHDKTLPIHASNVMLADPESGEPTRVSVRHEEDSSGHRRRIRVAKSSGKDID